MEGETEGELERERGGEGEGYPLWGSKGHRCLPAPPVFIRQHSGHTREAGPAAVVELK